VSGAARVGPHYDPFDFKAIRVHAPQVRKTMAEMLIRWRVGGVVIQTDNIIKPDPMTIK
jgi:hypothetical protein